MRKPILAALVVTGAFFASAPAQAAPGANFASAVIPGSACFSHSPIHLAMGSAYVVNKAGHPRAGSTVKVFGVHAGKAVLGGPGHATAVLPLECDNNGGTADGQALFSLMVFRVSGQKLTGVGLITPAKHLAHEPATIITTAKISGGTVSVPEFFYGPQDGTCCPSGKARTTWTIAGGRLKRGATTVTHPTS